MKPAFYISPERLKRAFVNTTVEEKERIRSMVVNTCLEVLRDCPDHATRCDAYAVLLGVGVPNRINGGWDRHYFMPGYWGDN